MHGKNQNTNNRQKKRNINDLRPFTDDICKPICVATPKMSSVLLSLPRHAHSYEHAFT